MFVGEEAIMTKMPNYSVIRKENEIELREYSSYIKAEKINMTSPEQVSQSQKIATTKPVTITWDGTCNRQFEG